MVKKPKAVSKSAAPEPDLAAQLKATKRTLATTRRELTLTHSKARSLAVKNSMLALENGELTAELRRHHRQFEALLVLARLPKASSALVDFAVAVLLHMKTFLGDLDGIWLRNTAVNSGLMTLTEATEPCGEDCLCEGTAFPTTCYRFPNSVRHQIALLQEDDLA